MTVMFHEEESLQRLVSSKAIKSASTADCLGYDFRVKIILIGDPGTGKSCFLKQFLSSTYDSKTSETIGVSFASQVIEVSGKRIKLQIWDTSGQERYRKVTREYYRGAAGAIVLYDISKKDTFKHLPRWILDRNLDCWRNLSIVAVGNKRDLCKDRQVPFLEASKFCTEQNVLFLETSALTGEGVREVFATLAQQILRKIDAGQIDPRSMHLSGTVLAPDQVGMEKYELARDSFSETEDYIRACEDMSLRSWLVLATGCWPLKRGKLKY